VTAGCRLLLQRFAFNFESVHGLPQQKACCYNLTEASTPEILLHSKSCPGVTREILDAMTVWENHKPSNTTAESTLFQGLSNLLHQNMFQGPGNVMWVSDGLEPIEKEWMLRYLGKKLVCDEDHSLSLFLAHSLMLVSSSSDRMRWSGT
jgi:hypothetical protein